MKIIVVFCLYFGISLVVKFKLGKKAKNLIMKDYIFGAK